MSPDSSPHFLTLTFSIWRKWGLSDCRHTICLSAGIQCAKSVDGLKFASGHLRANTFFFFLFFFFFFCFRELAHLFQEILYNPGFGIQSNVMHNPVFHTHRHTHMFLALCLRDLWQIVVWWSSTDVSILPAGFSSGGNNNSLISYSLL